MSVKAILTDTTLCTGCEQCVAACKRVNGLGPDRPYRWQLRINDLSATRFTTILHRDGQSVRQQCRHCVEPACVSACLVGAMQKTPEGPVIYDANRCMGCRYCMMACPFSIPRYEWKLTLPKVKKCTMCAPRPAQGKQPACTEVCPVQASIFGERDDLLRDAESRLKQNPSGYIQHIYGKEEAGGTSVLYLSAVPFEALGFPTNVPRDPLPMYTYRVLSEIPMLVTFGGVLLGGIWWITNRREEVARAENQEGSRK